MIKVYFAKNSFLFSSSIRKPNLKDHTRREPSTDFQAVPTPAHIARVCLSIPVRLCSAPRHRFSAFWLRSECSICSIQINTWIIPIWNIRVNWIFEGWRVLGACFHPAAGCPGIAVQSVTASLPPRGEQNYRAYLEISML